MPPQEAPLIRLAAPTVLPLTEMGTVLGRVVPGQVAAGVAVMVAVLVGTGVLVGRGVFVGTAVGVLVGAGVLLGDTGVFVGGRVAVLVGSAAGVSVAHNVLVGAAVGVLLGITVGVLEGVDMSGLVIWRLKVPLAVPYPSTTMMIVCPAARFSVTCDCSVPL